MEQVENRTWDELSMLKRIRQLVSASTVSRRLRRE
jgi:hypothetical protein